MKDKKHKIIVRKSKSMRSKRAGFTLIEALVSIAILTIAIAGPITIASKGLQSAIYARDQITAFYLAQEAVEFIRNRRDENKIKNTPWLSSGLGTCKKTGGSKPCKIDVIKGTINNCSGYSCTPLLYDSVTGSYGYSVGNPSIFTRNIVMQEIEVDEYSIEVTMSWSSGINQKTFTVKEYIFDWESN